MTAHVTTIETPSLGDRSYLVHDGSVGLVIDPQRDVDRILMATEEAGVRITHVCETHLHNDYVSGGLALCQRLGATLVASSDSAFSFEWCGVRDGDEIEVGSLRVRVLLTPGHTHEHLSYVVQDEAGATAGVFTGGSLLHGTVGRTDLVADSETQELTRAQWRSARRLADELGDDVAVYPTHGFGSFCAARAGESGGSGTIGDERRHNPALLTDDGDDFVRDLLAGLSEHPSYYAHMAHLNQAGMAEPDLSPAAEIDDVELATRLEAGEWVIDLRNRRAYAARHLIGSAGFEVDGPFVTYVGWLIPRGSPLTLIAESAEAVTEAQRELARIGIDRPSGAATGSLDTIGGRHPTGTYPVASFEDLATRLSGGPSSAEPPPVVVDVRRSDEWDEGHIADATNIPIHELLEHLHHVPAGELWVHCTTGARASIAASLLARASHDVVLIDDDFARASDVGLDVVE